MKFGYATNNEDSNSNASYEHRIQDYKFTIDASQVNDPVVTFPNGGENLIIEIPTMLNGISKELQTR